MQNNDISEIINMERQDISPAFYHVLQNSQPTSTSASPNTVIASPKMPAGKFCDITIYNRILI